MSSFGPYVARSCGSRRTSLSAVHEDGPPKPRLLDRVRAALRLRHYRRAHALPELTDRGRQGGRLDPASGAECAAVLYRGVLELDVPWLDGVVRTKRPLRLPVVLTREEVRAVLQRHLEGAFTSTARRGKPER
jgi:hypothetical protein